MKKLRLIVFDVDGTLVKVNSSWQFLHEKLGTWDRGRKYAEQFYRGDITYEDWARLDASLWAGLPLKMVQHIVNTITYTYGAKEAINALKKKGFQVVLLSAGLSLVTERIRKEISIDGSIANELIVKNELLTGEVNVKVSVNNKDEVLAQMLEKFSVDMGECAAVGDDETLIPLFNCVGLAIAFNPRSKSVEKHADIVAKSRDLRDVLPHLASKI